jgi:dTDP-4-amino-4,6-dideoxygalactose transaminase
MDPESFALHPECVEKSLVPGIVGIVVVHIGGIISAQMSSLVEMADRKGLWIVEDAAHAHGSFFRSQSAGSFGIAGSFSFYPTKVMTSAEGGMIVTSDDRLAEESRIYRDQGKKSFAENAHVRMGYNWRLSEPHAIIGLTHLQRLQSMIAERRAIAAIYDKGLKEFKNLYALKVPADGICNYYKYIVVMKEKRNRKELKALLRERYGVFLAGEVYEEPLHRQPVFEPFASGSLPLSEDLCSRHICLPVFSGMKPEEAEQVLNALRETIE